MPFFDFHLHPVLKSILSENNSSKGLKKLSPWVPIDKSRIPFIMKCCTEFPYILESQGNLSQLVASDCNFVCIALYIPEKDILTASLISDSEKGPLGIYLQEDKVNDIINGNPYKLLRTDDWSTLTNATQFGITNKKVKPIKMRSDYNENDTSTIHAVFSVEGCHTLSSALQNFDVDAIISNLDDLRSKVAVLSLNITHMEQSPLCNQAYGMLFLSNDGFKPTGNRFSPDGIKILQHCYANKIMIDIKHLSLGSRQHLYKLRQSPEFKNINQPIVCTHAGFTGISIEEIPDYIFASRKNQMKGYTVLWQGKPVKYGDNPRPSFNASSINLYDEDIVEILNSGGMIGLSMDKRILGYQEFEMETNGRDEFPTQTEYISNKEEALFFGTGNVEIGKAFEDMQDKVMQWDEIEEGGVIDPALSSYHLKHFMGHIIHVIEVAKKYNYEISSALNQICIGSDFDGLINPVWICSTVNSLEYFKSQFEEQFISFANNSNVQLPDKFDVKDFSNRLFFENGKDFTLSRLDILNL